MNTKFMRMIIILLKKLINQKFKNITPNGAVVLKKYLLV